MSTTQPGTVKETGASSGDVLIGVEPDANIGLAVEGSASQPKGEGGRIQGGFTLLDPGTGRYAAGIRTLRGEQIAYQTVASFLLRLQKLPGCETATHILNANSLRRADEAEAARLRGQRPEKHDDSV
jgi:hypothetical protein